MIPESKEGKANSSSLLTDPIIQQAFKNAKNNGISSEVLTNIFYNINLSREDESLNAEQIRQNINNKMIPKGIPQKKKGPFLDPKTVYPLSKAGGFGVLFRQCTIVEKGIQQKQGNKAPKFKQIIGFNNKIEKYGDKANDKLDWVKENKQYPFRLILRDKENKIKAIYFQNKQMAQKVRIHYVNTFLLKTPTFKKAIQGGEDKYRTLICQKMKVYLDRYRNQKSLQKQIQKQRQKQKEAEQEKKRAESKSESDNKKSMGISLKNQQRLNQNINKMEKVYKKKLFQTWLRKAQQKEENHHFQEEQLHITKIQNIEPKQKIGKEDPFNQPVKPSPKQKQRQKQNNNQRQKQKQRQRQRQSRRQRQRQSQRQEQKQKQRQSQRSKQNQKDKDKDNKSQQLSRFKAQSRNTPKRMGKLTTPKREKVIQEKDQDSSVISYVKIQFLKTENIFMKPIVILTLYNNRGVEFESKFNTVIKKKQPYLTYDLIVNSGPGHHEIKSNLQDYSIGVKVLDFLTNTQLYNDRIFLKNKVLANNTLLLNQEKELRLEILYESPHDSDREEQKQANTEGNFLQMQGLNNRVIDQIRGFWEKQSLRRGYYNASKDIKILQILQLSEQPPKFWSLGLTNQQYKIVSILNSGSIILKFKLTESILPIIKFLQKLYSEIEQLIEVCLSLILNYIKPFYLISQLNKTNKLHNLLGLQGQIEIESKVAFEIQVLKKIVKIECQQLDQKMKRRNIGYSHLIFEYVYEIYTRNFNTNVLVQLWNFLFKQPQMVPIYLLLLGVWILKFYSNKLINARRFKQIGQILTSKETGPAQTIIRQIIVLREKYFSLSPSNILDSIKDMFIKKPLEQVVVQFYKRETHKLDYRKQNRNVQKTIILQKLTHQVQFQLPQYQQHKYTLHIYFYKLPPVSGSLYIKTNGTEYECLNFAKNRYFVIGDVSTDISIQFINNKSNEYTCKLCCMQGINRYCSELESPQDNQVYKIQYICGLLTEGHIEILKKNRKFEHFIGPFTKKDQILDQFLRPINECNFLNVFARKLEKQDLGKKIKVVFSSGNKSFDQIEFYLRWLSVCPYSLPEKLKYLSKYSLNLSKEYFLSQSLELYRILLSQFLKIIGFHLSNEEFESYYSDSLDYQFKAARIIKCRLILSNGTEYKLESVANSYWSQKNSTHLYGDIIIQELLQKIQKQIQSTLGNISEGALTIVYSSYGQVKTIQIPIIKKKTSKDLMIDESRFQPQIAESGDIHSVEPEILVTEVLPTFSKISTILDFVNTTKSVQNLGKNKQIKYLPESLNLLKNCDLKYKKIVVVRYSQHPSSVKLPFLRYFHELTNEVIPSQIPKNLFLNNLQTDLKSLCIFKGVLHFSDNRKIQSTFFDRDLGLYANLRILPPRTDTLYFYSSFPEEKQKPNAQLFVNYGYGIYRWEPCLVLSYFYLTKEKQTNLKKEKKAKKYYLVRYKGVDKPFKDFQVRIDPKIDNDIQEMENGRTNSLTSSVVRKYGEPGNKRQLGTISKRNLIDESASRKTFN